MRRGSRKPADSPKHAIETDALLTELVRDIHRALQSAGSAAKAAAICVEAGDPARAVEMVIELGEELHDIDRLITAARVVNN